jgi:hypothetical protein
MYGRQTTGLQSYLAEAHSAFKADRHWRQQVLAIFTNGSERGDSEPPKATYPRTSFEVARTRERRQRMPKQQPRKQKRRCKKEPTKPEVPLEGKLSSPPQKK